ncbi:MAG TPA: sensor histidine kinase [Oligoflexia bacterium]|mgnify:CR=1 FL=1|nr:sensor histidine kinase [Oligoflexia bacterium]HMR24508.1 sensor histidine kinase [Oligoflexia bacterium]
MTKTLYQALSWLVLLLSFFFILTLFRPLLEYSISVPGKKLFSTWEITFSDPIECKYKCKWLVLNESVKTELKKYRGFLGFRIKVKNSEIPKKVDSLAVFLGPIGDIDEAYWNGNFLGKTGDFFPKGQFNHHESRVYNIPSHFVLEHDNQELILRVQKVAGPGVGPYRVDPYLGESSFLYKHKKIRDFISITGVWVGATILFVFGIYYFILYQKLVARRDYLYAALTLVFAGVYGTCSSFIPYLYTSEPGSLFRIHAISAYLTIGFLVAFIREYFLIEDKLTKWLNVIVTTCCVLISSLIVDFDQGLLVMQVWYLYLVLFCLWTPWIFWKNKKSWKTISHSVLRIGLLILCITIIHDILVMLNLFRSNLISIYGMFAFLGGICVTLLREFTLNYIKIEREVAGYSQKIYDTALQVAHDIRSPLTALNVVSKDLSGLPEGSRVLLRSSVQRIQDIANNLVSEGEGYVQDSDKQIKQRNLEPALLLPIIEEIISEKRHQLSGKENLEIILESEQSYGLFANIDQHILKRIISNLINNSVEAFESSGKVVVKILENCVTDKILISVKDNGKGIPKNLLPKLGAKGTSFGKDKHEESGSGLGIYHAKSNIELWEGIFSIESKEGEGTEVKMYLPKAKVPTWFVPIINLKGIRNIVVLDDDESIHKVWEKRLNPYIKKQNIDLRHANCPQAFDKLVGKRKGLLCLCDYELLGFEETGLDVIKRNNLETISILVTSRYSDQAVLKKCNQLGIKLIPKTLADLVPFTVKE